MKTLSPYWTPGDEDDDRVRVVHVPGRARPSHDALLAAGVIQPYGCDCGHCAAGWDCCGRLFPSFVTVRRVRGGWRVAQSYQRNI